MMANPTNTDIMAFLTEISTTQGKTLERVEATHNLAVKTNGRVTELERKWERREAVEEYKKTQELPQTSVKVENHSGGWTLRDVLAGLGVLAAAIALAIAQLTGGK